MKFLFALSFMLFAHIGLSQNFENESDIIELLGVERYNALLVKNPNYLNYLDVKCKKGFEILETPSEKSEQFKVIEAFPFKKSCDKTSDSNCNSESISGKTSAADFLQLFENGNLNFLIYQIDSDAQKPSYYKLGQTGKVLKVLSANELKAIVNAE